MGRTSEIDTTTNATSMPIACTVEAGDRPEVASVPTAASISQPSESVNVAASIDSVAHARPAMRASAMMRIMTGSADTDSAIPQNST